MRLALLVVISTFFIGTIYAQGDKGLSYSYYEGNWSYLPDFNSLTPVKKGTDLNANLTVRNRSTQYSILWSGSIHIPATGNYKFETNSDDGSRLYIGEYGANLIPVVNNDALHGTTTKSGTAYLTAGSYPIYISYLQGTGDQIMELYWSCNSTGLSRQRIPDDAFTNATSSTASSSTSAATTATLTYSYFEGNWENLPDFNSLSASKTGTATNFDLSIRNRNVNYAIMWKGQLTVPSEGNYTFETTSDDGSKLVVNNVAVVNNDGLHPANTNKGVLYLTAGTYPITATYLQNGGDQLMEVYWSSNTGLARQKISDAALAGTATATTPTAPSTPATPSTPVAIPDVPSVPSGTESGGLTGSTNYYFSSNSGDDSRSSAQAQNSATPWKSISKLNSVMSGLKAGDAVLLKRGETFDGTINITNSGTSGTPIIFSAYGSGNKPIINGFTTLTNWTSSGNGVWEASCPSPNAVSMVTLNGASQAMGRYPNVSDANKGYLMVDAHSGTNMIIDYELSGFYNWTGAEIAIRKNNWVIDRGLITYHNGNQIYFNSPSNHEALNGFGYFIQNSPLTLDQLGEWYFDPNQKKLKMYFGSNNPNSYTVRASTIDNLINFDGRSNILIDNISVQGSDVSAVKIANAQNIRIQNSDFNYSGSEVITASNTNNIVVENCTINNTNNEGIMLNGCYNSSVRYNKIQNTGLFPGMGQSNNQGYQGIHVDGSNILVEYNSVENTGYCGITFAGDNMTIKNNFVNYFTLVKDDGGGIYGWGDLNKYNRQVIGNVILNGIGVGEGTVNPRSTSGGITLDDESANVDIINNTVANCSRAAAFIHNSHDIKFIGNTFFNNKSQISFDHDDISPAHGTKNITMTNNILFSKLATQNILLNENLVATNNPDFGGFGASNQNYFTRPMDENGIINNVYKDTQGRTIYSWYNLDGWRTVFNQDWNSSKSPVKVPSYLTNYMIGSNKVKNGDFGLGDLSGLFCSGNCGLSLNVGRLDGLALQLAPTLFTKSNISAFMDIGAVSAGSKYIVKFTSLGASAGKTMRAYVMKNGGSYDLLSDTKYMNVSNTRSENEFLFTSPVTASSAFLIFTVLEDDAPIWIDNVNVQEANATITNPDDYIRFEYNGTTSAKTVSLDATYVDVKNNKYSGNITLDPFTSLILMKQNTSLVGDNQTVSSATNRAVSAEDATAVTSEAISLSVSPNPASNQIQIILNSQKENQKATLSINSVAGVSLKKIPVTVSKQPMTVDISKWSRGVYIVSIVYEDGQVINKKFVKQ